MKKILLFSFALIFALSGISLAGTDYKYPVKACHDGGDITPAKAHEMVSKDQAHTFIVDCRTRAEYEFVGHPEGAYNIPLQFLTNKLGKKGYDKVANENFGKDLLSRFNPKTDTLIFMCRSGKRSCMSCCEAAKAGFSADKLFNMMGGFEGDKVSYKGSAYHGKRKVGGWRNEGLPWSYHMDAKLAYQPAAK